MNSRKVQFTVGLFVAVGVAIAVALIVWMGFSKFLNKGDIFYTFFDESVRGLKVDAPVSFRGVTVGRVTGIEVAQDFRLIQVTIEVATSTVTDPSQMVAQMSSVGITGSTYIDLDLKKPGENYLYPDFAEDLDHPVIASRPSNITILINRFEALADKLDKLDLIGINNSAKYLFDTAGSFMKELDGAHIPEKLARAMEKLETGIVQATASMKRLDNLIAANEKDLTHAVQNFSKSSDSAVKVMESGARIADNLESLSAHARQLMRKLENTGSDLAKFMQILAAQPSMLLLSEPAKEAP